MKSVIPYFDAKGGKIAINILGYSLRQFSLTLHLTWVNRKHDGDCG
jgi:hypothetical protein